MANRKQHAAIDFQGAATIKIGGTAGNSQYLKTASNGLLQWASGTAGVSKYSVTITWGTNATGVSFSNDVCSITHNLGTEAVVASVKDVSGSSGYSEDDMHMDVGYDAFVNVSSPNVIKLEIEPTGASNPSSGDQFLVTVIG